MSHMIKGANVPVPTEVLRVAVSRLAQSGSPAVDASALLLDAVGKVRGDADLVFYNQPQHPSGAVRHLGATEGGGQFAQWLELDLARIEPVVQRVVIAASCEGGTFGAVPGLYVQAVSAASGTPVAHYPVVDAAAETAFVLGEFYRRDGVWKFRAVGQGWATGLAGLATDFGIVVDGAAPAPAAPAAQPAPVAQPAYGQPAYGQPAPVAQPAYVQPGQPAYVQPGQPAYAQPATPAAPQDARPVSFGPEFPVYVQRGRGQGVVSVDGLPEGPVLVELWHQGEGYTCVYTLNRRNKDDDLLFNTTLVDLRGSAAVHHKANRPLRLRVDADNDWTVQIRPVSVARELGEGLQGRGPEVLTYRGRLADLDVSFAGDEDGDDDSGSMSIYTAPAGTVHEDKRDMLMYEVGRLNQTFPLAEGPLILLIEADGAWSLRARPVPVPDPVIAQRTGMYEGRGEQTVTLVNPTPGRPCLLDYTIVSEDSWGYRTELIDEYDESEPYIEGSQDGETGRLVAFREGQTEQRIRIKGAVDWSLRPMPLEHAPPLQGPVEGVGRAVFRHTGAPMMLTLERTSRDEAPLVVNSVQTGGRMAITAQAGNGRRPVTGPVWVQNGECYVSVRAPGETAWKLTPATAQSAGSFDRKIEGRGYTLVYYSGPGADLVFKGDGGAIGAVWWLDASFEPVDRLQVGPGKFHAPGPGFLQVRIAGKWELSV
ncbi:TerD family protein [Streptomyces sp. N35]|uniref:TerD family protein n=1 Tax=Streptomyces sp. N35 TaxID=2795730 RepID=UPI0022782F5C|nr:TerD family protein [Streptomyces sp. N35]